MLINELPDDCLLTIFNHLSYLDDLINCYKVCYRWSHLVVERSKKSKYLIVNRTDGFDDDLERSYRDDSFIDDHVYFEPEKPIDKTVLNQLFGNLKIVDAYKLWSSVQLEDIVVLVKNQESLKGLIFDYNMLWESFYQIVNVINELEMISTNLTVDGLDKIGSRIKQMRFKISDLEAYNSSDFPNLERLNISYSGGQEIGSFDGMESLRILEMSVYNSDLKEDCALHHIDSCPNLQSAYIVVDCEQLYISNKSKHKSLQDLVLDFSITEEMNMEAVIKQLMKYPNLKHLSLKDEWSIKDEHIERMVNIFPNLVLFDVSGCNQVTKRSADFVQDYCKRYGRTIKFYFNGNKHEIKVDWPQLSTKKETISLGFDFMKNCFLKRFRDLPIFLIPDDF